MRSSSAAHVVAHGLVRRFGDLTAVDGIDLTRFEPPTEELTATPVSIGR